MQAKRLTLEANVVKAIEFDSFFSRSIIVKNMTSGAIQFCDGPFDAAKAAIIPAFGWQTFTVTVPYDAAPKFYVKADVAGDVEIDFGSDGMGFTSNTFDLAGMIPHTLTLTQGDNTTLAVTLTRLHGETLDLDTPVLMTSGATVFNGDVISITPTASAGNYAKIKINGIDYGRLEAGITLTISGETVIEAEAVALVEAEADTTAPTLVSLTAYVGEETRVAENNTLTWTVGETVTKIEAAASEPVRLAEGATAVVTISGGTIPEGTVYGTIAVDETDNTKLIITPNSGNETAGLAGTFTFTVAEGVIEDLVGNKNEAVSITLSVANEGE